MPIATKSFALIQCLTNKFRERKFRVDDDDNKVKNGAKHQMKAEKFKTPNEDRDSAQNFCKKCIFLFSCHSSYLYVWFPCSRSGMRLWTS